VEIFTIGFTKKTAREFFGTLTEAGVKRLADVRLNNRSQLAGFTKQQDLEYFLAEICGAGYVHLPELAPSKEMLRAYQQGEMPWEVYEPAYLALLDGRRVAETLDRRLFDVPVVLLCSEPEPDRCHRRLAAEYLAEHWGGTTVSHL
jgi:uncharacterized protein (DUF488 family)